MKRKLIGIVFALLPLFAGLFAVTTKPAPLNLEVYLGRYTAFLLLFGTWGIFRIVAIRLIPSKALNKKKQFGGFLAVAFLALLTIAAIFLFKRRFEKESYEIALLALGFSALWSRYIYLGRFNLASLWGVLADICIGFLSFQIVFFEWQWQPLVFSTSIACASVLVTVAARMDEIPSEKQSKLIRILFILMPVSIGLLVVSGALSKIYLITFFFVPAERLISEKGPFSFTMVVLLTGGFLGCLGALSFL